MNLKLILKLGALIVGLALVIFIRSYTASGSLTVALNSVFGVMPPQRHISWCAKNAVDFKWQAEAVSEKLKDLDMTSLIENYCQLTTEAIRGVDTAKVNWQPLAISTGPTGIKTLLEWNEELGLFRSGGLPFKSSHLSRELVDK